MASPVNPPRGMRDFLPAEKSRRERILATIRGVYAAHGFDEIETPVMEESARLHSGLGGDNEKLGFGILKRGLSSDDLSAASDPLALADLGLRFDLTVPLARFYASHRAELPTVFRSIQIAPVWRAERPQKGRYRQFVQCDIDVIGETGALAEVELIVATSAALAALGLDGCTIRINDRRLLTSMLAVFGFEPAEFDAVLITLDKLDKVGATGVITELSTKGFTPAAVEAAREFLDGVGPEVAGAGMSADSIRAALPRGVDESVIAQLAVIGDAVGAAVAQSATVAQPGSRTPTIVFDPFLVRGMGYYTGPIFEVSHPSVAYSLGGGGRYDGMIGRFLGTDVPATGFSLGFERIVDLLDLTNEKGSDAVALIYADDLSPAVLAGLKLELIATGSRVRLERRPRNLKPLFAQLADSGFERYAFVTAATASVADLQLVELSAG